MALGRSSRQRTLRRAGALVAALGVAAGAACGGDDDEAASDAAGDGSSGEPVTIGYSAWPGWFPWAVTEEQGIFEDAGVEVELEYFSDYLTSLDAMSAGQLDGNTQTLNDTLVGVSAGSDQVVVVVNDNSAGNDAIIVDQSINRIEDLAGKSIAAEPGVVDHFLLLQGLATVGLTEEDIQFNGLPTDQAAAAFAGGEFDAVGVFAPFTVQALERPGSKVLFDSADFPGTIPDFLVLDRAVVEERPEDVQKLVDAWYATLDWIEENPDEAIEIMAAKAEVSVEEYESFAGGTRIFSAEEALASMTDDGETDLGPITEQVSAFLLDTGLMETEPDLEGLYDPSFTEDYVDRQGG
ncbi:MAG TPA: ABC transporter substrate-binding protein [Acidimicrobiales bacterium]|nr:ABC transporter substrate-binding protein [Acidimicrobiales bacterium]